VATVPAGSRVDRRVVLGGLRAAVSGYVGVLVVVWVVAVGYLALRADQGWIPHDEGLLGQTAERVLAGELPHRDYDDTYSGGLALMHAAAFRAFGVELRVMRAVLLVFSAAFILATYWIAARVVPPPVAGLVTLVCVGWSVPNYFAGLPSWYNLFFATFGTAALLRHAETDRRRWLVLAGMCGGCAIVVKTIGVYFVAVGLLYLVYREQLLQAARADERRTRPGALALLTLPAVIAFVAVMSMLVSLAGGLMAVVQFVVPPAALAVLLASTELRVGGAGLGARLRELVRTALPFVAGVAAPCLVFAAPYVATGDVGRLLHGVFVLPQQRFEFAVFSLPPLWTLVAGVPLAVMLFLPTRVSAATARRSEVVFLLLVALAGVAVAGWGSERHVYLAVWHVARTTLVVATLAAVATAMSARAGGARDVQRRLGVFVVVASAALVNLVQFPYAFGIYFCYAAPLIVLAVTYVVAAEPAAPARAHVGLLLVALVFAVVWLNRGFVRDIGGRFTRLEQTTPLAGARAGLRVSAPEADLYRRLVAAVQAHSSSGDYVFATPDCPQVYFLADRRNPTRTFFDFFDADYADQPARRARLLALLEERDVPVIVINYQAEFSKTYDPELVRALVARYPHQESVAMDAYPGPAHFTVRWRDRR
jgi:hypothetical protein